MDLATIILTGVSVVLGGVINWVFSQKSSRQLRLEADNLRKLNGLTIRILAEETNLLPDNVQPTKDNTGNYTGGLTYSASAIMQGSSSMGVDFTDKRHSKTDAQDAQELSEGYTPE